MIALWFACATSGAPEPTARPAPAPVPVSFVLLHRSGPLFQAPDPEGPRGRLGVARAADFPAELWPAQVVAEAPGWLRVVPVVPGESEAHWADPPPVIGALGLAVWVPDTAPVPVVTRSVIQSWADGSAVALGLGTPLSGGSALVRAGGVTLAVSAAPGFEERGFRYLPNPAVPTERPVGWLSIDPELAFGHVGSVPLSRVPRAGRSHPETRIPLLERTAADGVDWGSAGGRTARVRAVLDPSLVRDAPGWVRPATVPHPDLAWEGWWTVAADAPVTWADGGDAGRLRHRVRFDVAPEPSGDRVCTWWHDLIGAHEAAGVTARWSTHATVLGQSGLRLCFPAAAVVHTPRPQD